MASTAKKVSAAAKALAEKRVALHKTASAKKLGLSYTKPDSALTTSQLKNRKTIQRNKALDKSPLYDPSQSLSGHTLANEVDTLANNTYDPQIAAAQQQITNAGTQYDQLAKNAAGYTQAVGAGDQEAQARGASIAAALQAAQASTSANAASALQAGAAADNAADQQGDAVRGISGSTTAVPNEEAQLAARGATMTSAQENSGNQQQANFQSLLNAMSQARQVKGAEDQQQISNARANDIAGESQGLAALQDKKGAFRATTLLDQRNQAYTNALAESTLGVKADSVKASIANTERSTAASRANALLSAKTSTANTAARIQSAQTIASATLGSKANIAATAHATALAKQKSTDSKNTQAENDKFLKLAGMSRGAFLKLSPADRAKAVATAAQKTAKATKPAFTPTQVQATTKAVDSAVALAKLYMSKPGANSGEVRTILGAGGKYSKDEINAAFDLLPTNLGGRGGLSAANVAALKRLGINTNLYPKAKPLPVSKQPLPVF